MNKLDDTRINNYRNITLTDLKLAKIYYLILIELAKHKHCLTYGELVERAKEENPENIDAQNAIAVSAGRRLDVVRMFTESKSLPDLTTLIISKATGEVGEGFPQPADAEKLRQDVYDFPWADKTPEFDLFITESENQITPRKKRKPAEARQLMSEHYQANKELYPASISKKRDQILDWLMDGFEVEEAFQKVLA